MRVFAIVMMVMLMPAALPAQDFDPVAQLKEKIIDLQNAGELGVRHFKLCSRILGFGQYVPMPGDQAKAGTEIYFYYEPVNLFTNRLNGTYHIWFTQDMIVLTEDGKELYSGKENLHFNHQSRSPVLDVYASNSLSLGNLPPGMYRFRIVVHDKLKGADVTADYPFEIVP